MKLESLRITECPYAFASFAEKHNALVDLIAGMTGQNGISVVIAEKNAIIRANANIGNVTGGFGNVNYANVVTSTGILANAYVANTNINAYPTIGKYVTSAGNVVIDSTGVVLTKSSGNVCNLAFASLTKNLSFIEIDVCSGNVAKKMLILGSSPY